MENLRKVDNFNELKKGDNILLVDPQKRIRGLITIMSINLEKGIYTYKTSKGLTSEGNVSRLLKQMGVFFITSELVPVFKTIIN